MIMPKQNRDDGSSEETDIKKEGDNYSLSGGAGSSSTGVRSQPAANELAGYQGPAAGGIPSPEQIYNDLVSGKFEELYLNLIKFVDLEHPNRTKKPEALITSVKYLNDLIIHEGYRSYVNNEQAACANQLYQALSTDNTLQKFIASEYLRKRSRRSDQPSQSVAASRTR
jgi:hypothetical protein